MAFSVPSKKGEAFNSPSKQWVHVSPVKTQEEEEEQYRARSGAVSKLGSTIPTSPSKTTSGFIVEPNQAETTQPIIVTAVSTAGSCSVCGSLRKELGVCTELNESLIRKFSRIILLIDKGKKLIEGFEKEMGLKRKSSDIPSPTPIFIASQNVCLMNEKDIRERKESGQEYQDIDLTTHMFPVSDHTVLLSELDTFCQKLLECLEECRAFSLSSANKCFESHFGSLRIEKSGKGTSTRPSLKRMHTLSNEFSLEHSLELGSANSGKYPSRRSHFSHFHSEHLPDEKSGTLIRTRSENELTSSDIESRVLMIENEPIGPLPHIDFGSSSVLYNRVLSTPSNQPHDQTSHDIPFRSHLMSLLRQQPLLTEGSFSTSYRFGSATEQCPIEGASGEGKPLGLTGLTGEESIHLLDKITILEQERLTLLTEIESMKEKNDNFWETLTDLREELDTKDLNLKLLKADVMLATSEIKRINERRQETQELRQDRDRLSERLQNLEDESKAVKDSLVQLVTEKAATNKALTIENQRLRQKFNPNQDNSQTVLDLVDGEPLSAEDEFRMKGLFMELSGSDYVHKQGFLVKQGHKLKNWKKRMFVLDTNSLSYYKTEQPLGSVPLEEIKKVQVCHSSFKLPYKYMFEIHRNDPKERNERIYYLSAPSHDEMQSWIGIIQTLKDTKRQSIRASMLIEGGGGDSTPFGSPERQQLLGGGGSGGSGVNSNKARSMTTQNSLTLPVIDRSRQRNTVMIESGVRNRMFTDTGQRRTDIPVSVDTSDEEDIRSPYSMSSDEEGLRDEGTYRLKYQK